MMRVYYLILLPLATILTPVRAQQAKIDSSYANWYYQQRMEYFEQMPATRNAIVFLGNSITERAEWQELLADRKYRVLNRGIGGDNSFGIRARLAEILRHQPVAVFLMDGINDQFRLLPQEVSIQNYREIIQRIQKQSQHTKIYLQSALPINETLTKEAYTKGRTPLVPELNKKLRLLAKEMGIPYIDLCPIFQDKDGNLHAKYTNDGVHLIPKAYINWVKLLKKGKYL